MQEKDNHLFRLEASNKTHIYLWQKEKKNKNSYILASTTPQKSVSVRDNAITKFGNIIVACVCLSFLLFYKFIILIKKRQGMGLYEYPLKFIRSGFKKL